MARISSMQKPALPLIGLELIPCLQGGGLDGNVGLPILSIGAPFGGHVLIMRAHMVADLSATADADPGAAGVRWNNADPDLATQIFIDDVDEEAGDVATALAALTAGGYMYLQGRADSEARDTWQKWQVTTIVDAAGYTKLGVSLQASNGTFEDDDALELIVQQPPPSPGVNRSVVTTVSSSGGVLTLDLSLGDFFKTTLTENITSIVLTNVPPAGTFSLRINQAAGTARTVTFPASFLKQGGGDFAVSTALGARDRIIFSTDDAGATFDVDIGKAYA